MSSEPRFDLPPVRFDVFRVGQHFTRQQRSVIAQLNQQGRKGKEVNKQELIDAIAKSADISKAAAGRALDA